MVEPWPGRPARPARRRYWGQVRVAAYCGFLGLWFLLAEPGGQALAVGVALETIAAFAVFHLIRKVREDREIAGIMALSPEVRDARRLEELKATMARLREDSERGV